MKSTKDTADAIIRENEALRKQIWDVIKSGCTIERFKKEWDEYHSHYCSYTPAYSQECGSNKRPESIAVMSVKYGLKEFYLCETHAKKRCFNCGKQAVEECHYCMSIGVCGRPHCPDHNCNDHGGRP